MPDSPPQSPSRAKLLYGTEEAEPPPLRLEAGRLSFELIGGNVRAISFAGFEVLRGIQYLVRDQDWGTLVPRIERLVVRDSETVRVEYRATCADDTGARLDYEATIVATDAELEFAIDCVAQDDIVINRLGFCVLHPADLSGHNLRVEHGDGSVEESIFPTLIEPWQPFTDIRALTHEQGPLSVECRLHGETFEMEDQRNWSDASFKTYGRPLVRPRPYQVAAGIRNRQSVRIRVGGTAPSFVQCSGSDVEVRIGQPIGTMPRMGLVIAPEEAAATLAHSEWLARSGVQDVLLTFNASAGHGLVEMEGLARAAGSVNARRTLECVLACSRDMHAELGAIAEFVRQAGLELDAIALFPAPDLQSTPPGSEWPECPPLGQVYAAARDVFPGLDLGGGMFSYFTEFNRKRVPTGLLDFVTHATCPIVHAADDTSVMQTLQTVPHIVRSARQIAPDRPYRLGPITIGMRQNPYGSRTISNPNRGRIPMAREDPRQKGRFAAAWTLGYAAATEEAGLDTLTLGAVTGPFGIVGSDGPRPVFDTVAALAQLAGASRRACSTLPDRKIAGLCAGDMLLLANLTAEPIKARVESGPSELLDAFATAFIALR